MKILFVLILLFLPFKLYAWETSPWTGTDTFLQAIVIGTIIIDASQTYTFLYTGDYRQRGYYETNPVLGKYPNKERFFVYWGACIILHTSIAYILPNPARNIWQCLIITTQTYTIRNNHSDGIHIGYISKF